MATPSLAMIPSAYADSKVYSVLPNNGDGDFTFDRASTATRIGQNGLIQTVATDVPRLNYDISNGVVQSCPSLLLEPASTNLITHSEDFSNAAWTKTNVSITSNATTSPEGISNASLLTENSSNAQHFIGDSLSLTSGTAYSVSFYAKKKERSILQVSPSSSHIAASYANYDLDSGVVSATGGSVTAEMQSLSNDWYRCILTFTVTSTATASLAVFMQISTSAARGAVYQGNGTSGVYIFGAQIEALSYPTSYIPTNGAIQTRAAETCNNVGTASTFNSTEGVLYAEVALNGLAPNSYIQISDNSYSNRVAFINNNSATAWRTFYRVGGASQIDSTASGLDVFVMNKIALSWKVNQFKFYVNGTKIVEDTSGSVNPANTFTRIDFSDIGNTNKFYGKVKGLAVYNEALTDAQLQTLTTL